MEILGTVIPFIGRTNDYSDMLNKLAGFVFWECVLCIALLRRHQEFNTWLSSFEQGLIPNDAIPENLRFLSPLTLGISILVAIIFHFTQLHNQIQKPFGIRKRFDTEYILKPLALGVGVSISKSATRAFHATRHTVMQRIFYRYASSTKSDSLVDKHNIVQALWRWTWFWMFEEGALLFLTFAVIAVIFGIHSLFLFFVAVSFIFVLIMALIKPSLVRAARSQIEQILDNQEAKSDIWNQISAL